jgi:hypothetical protein
MRLDVERNMTQGAAGFDRHPHQPFGVDANQLSAG